MGTRHGRKGIRCYDTPDENTLGFLQCEDTPHQYHHLYSQMEQSVFFFLVADDSCSKESIRAVSDVVQQYRFTPIQPFFPIEVQEDSRKIEQIITANPAYLLLLPDHMARTLDTPTVSFEELSLRNIFYRELLADA